MNNLDNLIDIALKEAIAGKPTPELKLLYKSPYRENVNWSLFPPNFRPPNPEDFECHEG